jgi:hypothetical protein
MAKHGKTNPYRKRYLPLDGHMVIDHPLYGIWNTMKERCNNIDNPNYKNYGGRGIKMCKRWLMSFDCFVADMGPRPSEKHSIDRLDNDKGYEPANCRWATRSEQMLNRRMFKSNTSGNTGVLFVDGRYAARVDFEKERFNLGRFATLAEAEAARVTFQELILIDKDAALAMTERRARYDSKTQVRGISAHSDGGFTVRKTINKTRVYLGYRKTFEEAHALWIASN